jgi:hypothetical protein
MNDTTLLPDFKWLFNQNPNTAFLAVLLGFSIWMSIKMTQFNGQLTEFEIRLNGFEGHLTVTENLVRDINERQLPEIRNDIKNLQKEMDARFEKVDERFDKVELSLNTIITYLSAKK